MVNYNSMLFSTCMPQTYTLLF